MFSEALRAQAEVARAFAQGQTREPTVIFPAGGGAGIPTFVSDGRVSGEVQVCPRCRVKSSVGTKYCTNCGQAFYET
jgi:hypothetical protein